MRNEDGIRIATERYDYLCKQSAKKYIRIGERTTQANERTTNSTPQNIKVSNDVKHTGKQLDPMLLDDLIGFENYLKNMLDKPDSKMEFQSGGVDDAAKTRHSHCRRRRQKDNRQISQRELSKYWSSY